MRPQLLAALTRNRVHHDRLHHGGNGANRLVRSLRDAPQSIAEKANCQDALGIGPIEEGKVCLRGVEGPVDFNQQRRSKKEEFPGVM